MTHFIDAILAADNQAFRQDFLELHRRIAAHGLYNSLAQVTLKVGAPGIPDFYQGTELWSFTLVDPDNRRAVDYTRHATLLAELHDAARQGRRALAERVMTQPADDRTKLFTTTALLQFRREQRRVLEDGTYQPLQADGTRAEHVFAFARAMEGATVIVVVPRLVATLQPDADTPPTGERVWGDTVLRLPDSAPCCFRQVLTDERIRTAGDRRTLRLAEVFAHFPVAVLHGDPQN
jgi:(1->4)-alpha-D-glucan 1-alpha-D-glucosylmutase